MLTFEQTNILGQILTDKSAPGQGNIASITSHLQGDTLILTYQTIVNFASERSLRLQTDKLAYESSQILKKKVSNIKKLFSESSDDPLSLKEEGATDDVELIQATSISPLKVGYYRRKVRFRIEN
tara:strand:- start:221 stop:595 length:375 start_codon:yes stop_codon:yes gene_type:complete